MRKTILSISKMKGNERIAAITSYSFLFAHLTGQVGMDIVLVGDSMGNVLLGYPNTLMVTLEDILYHMQIVKRANEESLLVADMPFMTYEHSKDEAIRNAGKLVKAGANAVKVEGATDKVVDNIIGIRESGIPVIGHIGLKPQSINMTSGYKIQGRTKKEADTIIREAQKLQDAGVFAIVIECVPNELAKEVTEMLRLPTIGIGAGNNCDGQILVLEDMLGLTLSTPKYFVKEYLNLLPIIQSAIKSYKTDVKNGIFPGTEHSF